MRYNLKVNDEATRYAVVRTLLEDPRVWSSLYKGEPVTTTRSFEEPLKGIGMVPLALHTMDCGPFIKSQLTLWADTIQDFPVQI